MTALAMDVREMSLDEIDQVNGGGLWLVAIPVGLGIAAAAASYRQRRLDIEARKAAEKDAAQ